MILCRIDEFKLRTTARVLFLCNPGTGTTHEDEYEEEEARKKKEKEEVPTFGWGSWAGEGLKTMARILQHERYVMFCITHLDMLHILTMGIDCEVFAIVQIQRMEGNGTRRRLAEEKESIWDSGRRSR